MAHILFVGGGCDGERRLFRTAPTEETFASSHITVPETKAESATHGIRTERYRLTYFRCDGNTMIFYRHAAMTETEAMLRLIEGYNPRG